MPMDISPLMIAFYTICFGGAILHYIRPMVRTRVLASAIALRRSEITGAIAAVVLGGSAAAFMVAGLAETRWPVPVAAPTTGYGIRPLDMLGFTPQVVAVTVGTVEWIGDRHCRVPVTIHTAPTLVASVTD